MHTVLARHQHTHGFVEAKHGSAGAFLEFELGHSAEY